MFEQFLPLRIDKDSVIVPDEGLSIEMHTTIKEASLIRPKPPHQVITVNLGVKNVTLESVSLNIVHCSNWCRRIKQTRAIDARADPWRDKN